jgi:hypothetical protein
LSELDRELVYGNNFDIYTWCYFLEWILVIPSGIPAQFDGLPWGNGMETIAISVIVPFLLALS